MPQKIALCIGQNNYAPESGVTPLRGCINDALLVGELLRRADFEVVQRHDSAATHDGILGEIELHVARLRAGDHLVIWNASHGYQLRDADGDEGADSLDEAICTYDNDMRRALTDDKLAAALSRAQPEAAIFIGSDSCHSGTLMRTADPMPLDACPRLWDPPLEVRNRMGMPSFDISGYLEAPDGAPRGADRFGALGAAATRHLLLAGCDARQMSWDAKYPQGAHGAMTYHFARATLAAWQRRRAITYAEAHRAAGEGIRSDGFVQDPQLEGPQALKDAPVFGHVPR